MKTKRTLRILAAMALVVTLAVVGVLTVARFHDGPLEGALAIVAGGAFESGERQSGSAEPDWSFLRDYATVEFQLLEPPRSRTTWIMEHEGRIFIVSGYMNTLQGRIWKHWPQEAVEDGRAILRVDGKLYERQMVRIQAGAVIAPVLAELSRKYAAGADIPTTEVASGNIWMFEMLPRR